MFTIPIQGKRFDPFELTYWLLEAAIDPGVRASDFHYAETLSAHLDDNDSWLDVGCGHSILPEWIPNRHTLVGKVKRAIGADCHVPSLRQHKQIDDLVAGDLTSLPFRDGAFDRVSANMVVEHLADPVQSLKEIHRLLRPNGLFIFHTPNRRHYITALAARVPQWIKNRIIGLVERRAEADVFPTHYRMNRLRDIRQLAAKCCFRVLKCESLNSSSTGSIFLGPFVIFDLLIRRLLRRERFSEFRSHLIVVLEKY